MPPSRTAAEMLEVIDARSPRYDGTPSSEVWRGWVSKSAGDIFGQPSPVIIGNTFRMRTVPLQVLRQRCPPSQLRFGQMVSGRFHSAREWI